MAFAISLLPGYLAAMPVKMSILFAGRPAMSPETTSIVYAVAVVIVAALLFVWLH